MADWPSLDDFKRRVDLDPESSDRDAEAEGILNSAIAHVKDDVGDWNDLVDVPDDNHSQAALRMAELMAQSPGAAVVSANDPAYTRLMKGRHRRFAIA